MTGTVPRHRSPAGSPPRLGAFADAIPHLVWIARPDGVVVEYSRRVADYGGATRTTGGGYAWQPLVHPDDLPLTLASWRAAVAAGTEYECEHRLLMADGRYRWHLSRAVPQTDPETELTWWYGTATDIDARRAAEDLLRATQGALTLAMRGGRMGWWQRDLTTDVVTWSPELEALFGLEPGAFSGDESAFMAYVHPGDRAAVTAAVAGAIRGGGDYVVEFRFRRSDGSWGWMEGRGRATYDPDGRPTVLYGIGIDVSENKAIESAVLEREERLSLAAEVGRFGLYDLDFIDGEVFWSAELRRMLATTPEEGSSSELGPIHPDDREATLARFEESRSPVGDGVFDHEYRITRSDGAVRWLSVHGQTFFSSPQPTPDRQAIRAIGVVADITDRKQADEVRDVFVGMLSHELRTPVTAIFGGSQMLRRPNLDEKTRREIIDDVAAESERLERLVENLLVLARAERHEVQSGRDPVLLRPLIERIVADKRRRWPGYQINVDVPAGLPPAIGDEGSLELVIRNLISNSLKYGPPGGEIIVRARPVDGMLQIAVLDEGPGLPKEEPERLFDLFYRTDEAKRRAQGAGIGLFVVRALVESVGGTVVARDRPDGGAEFAVNLIVFSESDDAEFGEHRRAVDEPSDATAR
jgi:PAS domain S-box-containing protein